MTYDIIPDPPKRPPRADDSTATAFIAVMGVLALICLAWRVWEAVQWRRRQEHELLRAAWRTRSELRARGIRRRRAPAEPTDTAEPPAA